MPVPFGGMPINFGRAIPSGSHCGTYRSFVSGGGHTNISIKNYNYGNGGCCGDYNIFGAPYMGGGYYGGGCCGGGGISAGAAWDCAWYRRRHWTSRKPARQTYYERYRNRVQVCWQNSMGRR